MKKLIISNYFQYLLIAQLAKGKDKGGKSKSEKITGLNRSSFKDELVLTSVMSTLTSIAYTKQVREINTTW